MTFAQFRHTLAAWHAIAGSAEYAAAANRSRPPVHPARSAGLAISRSGAARVLGDGQRARCGRRWAASPGLRLPVHDPGGPRARHPGHAVTGRASIGPAAAGRTAPAGAAGARPGQPGRW